MPSIPTKLFTPWTKNREKKEAVVGGFLEVHAKVDLQDAKVSLHDAHVEIEVDGIAGGSHSNVELPTHPRRKVCKVLVGGSAVAADSVQLDVPIPFVAVTGLGEYIVRNNRPVHTIAKSHGEAAAKLYAKWREGKITDGPGGFTMSQATRARLRELLDAGEITQAELEKYATLYDLINTDKVYTHLLVRVANPAEGDVQSYLVWTRPIVKPSAHKVKKGIVAETTTRKIKQEEIKNGIEVDDSIQLVFYESAI